MTLRQTIRQSIDLGKGGPYEKRLTDVRAIRQISGTSLNTHLPQPLAGVNLTLPASAQHCRVRTQSLAGFTRRADRRRRVVPPHPRPPQPRR